MWSRPPWIPRAASQGSFSAGRDERQQRRRLPRAPTPSCGLYSAVCSPSCPLLREASAAMTSMATTKGAHAAVRSLCFTGRDYSDSLADRAAQAGPGAFRGLRRSCGHCVFLGEGLARANIEPQRRRRMKKRKQRRRRRRRRRTSCRRLLVLCCSGGHSMDRSQSSEAPVRL